jgi:clathrin heavy chain
VFDLSRGPPALKQCEIADEVVFWRWISNEKLGVVGKRSVYHVDITKPEEPAVKIFDRDSKLDPCQIMSYDMDAAGKWCYLIGLYSAD